MSVTALFDVDARNDPFLVEYERARDLAQTDGAQAFDELERLAKSGSIMSILFIADALQTGWLYDQDLEWAEVWYRRATESGSARGLCGLGITHLLMERFSEAIEDLEAAIARRYPPAYNILAGIHFRGDGVPVDRQRAKDLWRKGAALGHLRSQENLIRQSILGRYGLRGRLEGWWKALPMALEIATAQVTDSDTDRLR